MIPTMTLLLLLVASLVLTDVEAQLNPLGRFGKCINVDTKAVDDSDFKGTWYLQYRPENPDHDVHTCQAQFEHKTEDGILHSLLYYYNKNTVVNNPQHIKYKKIGPGKYERGITVDDEGVYVICNVIDYDKPTKSRVLYYCTNSALAKTWVKREGQNPDIFNVQIATVDQLPDNLEEVLAAGKAKLLAASPKFDVPLMKVEQSKKKCKELKVSTVPMENL